MSKPLPQKQEKFAQCIVSGMTQADAYRNSFNVRPNTKPESIWQKASEIMGKVEVASRVAELKEQLAEKALWTREESVNKLKEALDIADRPNDIVAVVKELNAMHGYNAPIKQEVEHKGGVQLFIPSTEKDL